MKVVRMRRRKEPLFKALDIHGVPTLIKAIGAPRRSVDIDAKSSEQEGGQI